MTPKSLAGTFDADAPGLMSRMGGDLGRGTGSLRWADGRAHSDCAHEDCSRNGNEAALQ